MNELITPDLAQLPALPTDEVKDGVDKIGAYIGMLSAAKKATADQTIIDKVDDQIRTYSALRLRWQMELGRRTTKFEGAQGKRTDFAQAVGEVKTRTEQLRDLGISTQRASENERMASESQIVEEYIERTVEQKETPTTSGALRAIQEVKKPYVVNNSKDDEWYTPEKYIESARKVMGSIDLDPASNDFANETVKAETYFDESMNGLEQEWFGNVWLNPPYSSILIQRFAEKVAESTFKQAVILVNNATETGWFLTLIEQASAVVFTTGRIKYRKRDGEKGTPLQGQAFIYIGDSPETFLEEFREYGWGGEAMNNYSDASRGTFQNEDYAKQLVSFEGMRFRGRDGKNNVTPTDIDGLVQLDNENCVIFFELKHKDGMPRGQLLALQDVCDAVEAGGRNSIVFLATHGTPAGQTIAAKDAETRTYYWRGEWRDIKPPKTLYEAINQFIGFVKAKGETT